MTMPAMCSAVNRGVLRVRQERFEDAITDLKSAIERKPRCLPGLCQPGPGLPPAGQAGPGSRTVGSRRRARAGAGPPLSPAGPAPPGTQRAGAGPGRLRPGDRAREHELAVPGRRPRRTRSSVAVRRQVRPGARLIRRGSGARKKIIRWVSACGRRRCSGWADSRKSIKAFDHYLETGKPQESVYRGRGLARAELGQYPGAIEDFTKALELHPTSAVQAYRGWTHLVVDAPKLALRDFELAIELDPKNGDAYNGRGFVRASLGRYREAAQDAAEALRHGPTSPRLLYNAARIYAQCPGPYRERALELDREGLELAARRRASGLLVDAYSIGCGPGRRCAGIRRSSDFTPSCPRGSDSWLFEDESRACAANRAAGGLSGMLDGDWLEQRTLLAASPLATAVPLHFGAVQRCSGVALPVHSRRVRPVLASRCKKARRSTPASTPRTPAAH